MVADDRRFADDHPCAVVDEACPPDGRAGVDVDARQGMGGLGHHAGDERDIHAVQAMRHAVDEQCAEARIAQGDLHGGRGSRVALEGSMQILQQQRAQLGQGGQEVRRLSAGASHGRGCHRREDHAQRQGDLIGQQAEDLRHAGGQCITVGGGGEEQMRQMVDEAGDVRHVRMVGKTVDDTSLGAVRPEQGGQVGMGGCIGHGIASFRHKYKGDTAGLPCTFRRLMVY